VDGNYLGFGIRSGDLQFNNILTMRAGKVGIGTNDPAGKLHVVGSGDASVQLPTGSISSGEIMDEPGVSMGHNDTPVTVYHGQAIASMTTYFPGPGYALVVATANWYPKATEHTIDANLSISESSDVLGDHTFRYNFTAGSHIHNLSSTIHDVIEIDAAGTKSLYLMLAYWETAENTTTTATGQISVLYVPTWYGAIVLPSADETEAVISGETPPVLRPPYLEEVITERVRAETDIIRADFEQQLQALREDLQQKLGEYDH
jgi:hypothetical protein